MTTNQAIAKLSALKQTCRNVGMSIAPKDIEDIQVFLIESEKRTLRHI